MTRRSLKETGRSGFPSPDANESPSPTTNTSSTSIVSFVTSTWLGVLSVTSVLAPLGTVAAVGTLQFGEDMICPATRHVHLPDIAGALSQIAWALGLMYSPHGSLDLVVPVSFGCAYQQASSTTYSNTAAAQPCGEFVAASLRSALSTCAAFS